MDLSEGKRTVGHQGGRTGAGDAEANRTGVGAGGDFDVELDVGMSAPFE